MLDWLGLGCSRLFFGRLIVGTRVATTVGVLVLLSFGGRLDYLTDRYHLIVFGELLQAHAGSHSALNADVVDLLSDHNTISGGNDYLVAVSHDAQASQARLGGLELRADDADTGSSLLAELVELDALAVAVVGDDQNEEGFLGLDGVEADDRIGGSQCNRPDTACGATHRSQLLFAVANAHAVARADDHIGLALRRAYPAQFIAIAQCNGDDAAASDVGEFRHRHFLDVRLVS